MLSPFICSLSLSERYSSKIILPAFALFLHRTFLLDVVYIKTDGNFVCSNLHAETFFEAFEAQISVCDYNPSFFSFSVNEMIPAPVGVFIKDEKIHLFCNLENCDQESLNRWKTHLENIIEQVSRNPLLLVKKFSYLSNEERDLILETWNATDWSFPNQKMLHEFVEEQAAINPKQTAVCFQNQNFSYEELNTKANQLAHLLRSKSVTRETLVAICIERSFELVVGLLAILKAGGAYVPMDPSYPQERLQYILKDSKSQILLTEISKKNLFADVDAELIYLDNSLLFEGFDCFNPSLVNKAEDLCYVIYTSGSTGKPKGVGNIHKGVVNRILWMQDKYQLQDSDRVLQKTPFGFDVSVWEFFWPLMTGATLVVAEPNIHKDAVALADIIERKKITHLHFVPSMLSLFLEAEVSSKCSSIKKVFTSGEALSFSLQSSFFAQYQAELHNLYGPTEASIDVTFWKCDPNNRKTIVPIGFPIANTQIYILDEYLQPMPIGVAGELFIGGVGLARGYIHRKELTEEKFIDHPFKANQKLYRSGDLCRFLSDGSIEYLGRLDHQIKLRGFRIELGEVESEVRKHPLVENVAVIAREEEERNTYLCAYIIAKGDPELIKKDLLESLSTVLPEYMIPSFFVFLETFPLSPNGKLETRKLLKPEGKDRIVLSSYVEATTTTQKQLQEIWKEILKCSQIGINDHFFAVGGHSLLAMKLVLSIKKKMKKQIDLFEIFQHPTIESQNELLSSRELIDPGQSSFIAYPEDRYQPFPLTDIQRAYLIGRTDAFALGKIKSHIYVENEREEIDVLKLEIALNILIKRHDMLRAVIFEDGSQAILENTPNYFIELQEGSLEEARKKILKKMKQSSSWPFFHVSCTKPEKGLMVVHFFFDLLIADGAGLEIFFEELSLLYENVERQLPLLTLTYRDSILALDRKTDSFYVAKQYWDKRIDSFPEAPELPTKAIQQKNLEFPFVRRKGRLNSKEWKSLQSQAASLGITAAAMLVTIYGEVIKTWSKSDHFLMNLMFFNRPLIHPEIDRVVGNFSTTLLLEMNLSGKDSLKIKAKKIQKQLLEDLQHSEYGGIKVLNEMNRRKGGSSAAAMPVVFACALNLRADNEIKEPNFFKWYGQGVSYSQLETPQVWVDHQVYEDEDGSLCFFWDVREEYFPDGLIEKMFSSYENYLNAVSNNLDEMTSITPQEDIALIELVNKTEKFFQEDLLHLPIFERAKSHPNAIAVLTSSCTLTYEELTRAALALSKKIASYQVKPNDLIAIVMEKGWEQIVAVLAIHLSGAAYIPIDVALPKERILQILDVSKAKVIISQKKWSFEIVIPCLTVELVEADLIECYLPSPAQNPSDLAYVIFTSGSTGVPKGVMIEHGAALNTIESINEKYNVTERDRAFAISSLSFDLSVFDVFGLLRVGASIYIPTHEEIKDPKLWLNVIEKEGITLWNSAPALMQVFMDAVELHSFALQPKLRLVMMSGDWIPILLSRSIKRYFSAQVVSLGGATEASIWSNDFLIEEEQSHWTSIPYGKPLSNQTMRVLDENLSLRPIWASGMIYIGGRGLSRGYLGDEEKTKKSFVIDPITKERLYKTGDLGRLCSDGNIEFLGREDLQVKIQGYRIELEEIESVCRELEEIQQVLVRIIGGKHEAKYLVAFYVQKRPIEFSVIKEHLSSKLPFYMVPNHFIPLEQFPLNVNGKVDIKALVSRLQEKEPSSDTPYEEPKGSDEVSLAEIWQELLHVKKIGRLDNFFALGGTSFLAFQMIHKAQKELGLSFSLSILFQKGTISQLLEKRQVQEDPSFVVLQSKGEGFPLFFIHPSGGGVLCYTEMAQLMGEDRPFYALQAPGFMDGRESISSVQEMADHYLRIILSKQKTGPYLLGGWSFGGVVSFEIAATLIEMGHEVLPVFMIDSPSPVFRADLSDEIIKDWFLQDYGDQLNALDEKSIESFFKVFKTNIRALASYQPKKQAVDIRLMKAMNFVLDHLESHPMKNEDDWGWSRFSSGRVEYSLFEADHNSILKQPHLSCLVESIEEILCDSIKV